MDFTKLPLKCYIKKEEDAIVPVSTNDCLICIGKLIVQRSAIEKDDKENDT